MGVTKANFNHYKSVGNLAIMGWVARFLFSSSLYGYLPKRATVRGNLLRKGMAHDILAVTSRLAGLRGK